MSKLIAAGFIIFRRFNQNKIEYLLLQASSIGQHWTPPKGHLDNGETPLQAAERETKEETGLDRNDIEYVNRFEEKISYYVNGKPKDVYYYLARLKDPLQNIRISTEHRNFVWSNLEDACDKVKYGEMKNVLKKADVFLSRQ